MLLCEDDDWAFREIVVLGSQNRKRDECVCECDSGAFGGPMIRARRVRSHKHVNEKFEENGFGYELETEASSSLGLDRLIGPGACVLRKHRMAVFSCYIY